MVLTMSNEVNRYQTAQAGRFVRRESDARRDLERMHLRTVRREKMRLQQELERVRVNKSNNTVANNAKLLSNRFALTSADAVSGDGADRRRRLTPGTAKGARARSVSPNPNGPRRTRTAGHSSGSHAYDSDHGLPLIGIGPSPIKGEIDMRRFKDEIRDPKAKITELKKNEGRQKNLLSLKVDRFTRSLSPVSSRRLSPVSSPSASPKPLDELDQFASASDRILPLKRDDSDVDTRVSYPPSSRKKITRESISDLDVGDAKDAISRRLRTMENDEGRNILPQISATVGAAAPPPPLPRRPTIIRRESQAAILDREDVKKNKYAVAETNNNSGDVSKPSAVNSKKVIAKEDSVAKEIGLTTLGRRDAKRVREIIENPEIVFDQEKYAPDGALRTVHMLPDADSAYGVARKARYLRWRDPNETNYEQELSIADIFAKGK